MPHPKDGYKLDGLPIPSVTQIVNRFSDKGGLMIWAFNQGKEGKDQLYGERESAAEVGTVAHAMVEQYINRLTFKETLQDFASVPAITLARANAAFDTFRTWERQTNLKVVYTEESLVCECHRYGGTLDAIGEIEDKLCLLDFKTGSALYHDALYQLAAYRHLWAINHPSELLEGGFHLLRFSKISGDFAHHFFPELDSAWAGFELMRTLFDIDKDLKKRAA